LEKALTLVRSIKVYLYTWALTTIWTNIVCATLKSITKHKKSFHSSITLQLDKTSVFLKHPGVKSRRPVHCVFCWDDKAFLLTRFSKGFYQRTMRL